MPFNLTELELILILLGFSTTLQALTAGLIFVAMKRAKESDRKLAVVDAVANKTYEKAKAANFAAAGLLELDA